MLERAGLGGNQAEHDEFVFGYVAQRFERARPMVVVLEQESVYRQPPKERATNRFITALGEPPAALIATSEMKRKSDSGKSRDDCIVQLGAAREPSLESPTLLFVEPACLGIEH